mmetsp:Transcript_2159/g.3275  ORF Transcript_2159/g.3275 Transcript_2159/m.3275 type:complete len:82 (-) Transcript_2159:661-906(-)
MSCVWYTQYNKSNNSLIIRSDWIYIALGAFATPTKIVPSSDPMLIVFTVCDFIFMLPFPYKFTALSTENPSGCSSDLGQSD